MHTELLAPAKDKETAFEAINCGADAVYIGANSFGARKNASNNLEDVKDVIDHAHKFWAKVFVTMNTILTDSELDEATQLAIKLSELGVDALIIQDLGLLEKLKSLIDSGMKIAPIHMSTQCDNYLPEKVDFFNKIGVSRVILARELSIEQIEEIHKKNPNLELEAFIHGALCVSMSGQCYLSQYIGGRSANRGECAQPCRKKYSVETADGEILAKDIHALCLKDFNASEHIDALINAGIYSFKIEGRLKDVGYVKNIVSYYRQKLGKGISSGRSVYTFIPNPEKSFNRGFTDYFLKKRTNCFNFESPKSKGEYLGKVIEVTSNKFKIKTDTKIRPQDGLYFNGDGCLVNKIENGLIYPNKNISLKIGDEVYRNQDIEFEKELSKTVKRQIGCNIKISDKIYLTDEDGVTTNLSLPEGERAKNPSKLQETFIKQFSKTGESDFYLQNIEILSKLPFMPVSLINQLRRILFEKHMQKRIEIYYQEKKEWQKELNYTNYFIKEVDYRANVHNKLAEEFYKKCNTAVIEHSFESTKPKREIALMRCKHCIKFAFNLCKSPKKLILRDEFNNIYPLEFDCKNCQMSVIRPNQNCL